jgi:hypothetical protein
MRLKGHAAPDRPAACRANSAGGALRRLRADETARAAASLNARFAFALMSIVWICRS